jgi:phosphonate transport system permease protein
VLALHSAGASPLQAFAAAIWPQARASVVAYTLYSFECCVRAAAVLGLVGAGGIGAEINLSMRLFEYRQITTLLAAFVVLVLATDGISRRIRGGMQRNAVHGSGTLRSSPSLLGGSRRLPRASVLLAVVLSFWATDFFAGRGSGAFAHLRRFIAQLFPPDLDPQFLRGILEPLWQTIAISVVGTAIGIVLGSVLALPATASLTLYGPSDPDRPRTAGRALLAFAYGASRTLLALLRSIPELVWVLFCILAVGLGAFAGALALGLHTAGVLGKLYAETIEEVPQGPLDELQALGATRLQRVLLAALPQAREMLASYTLLRWETNLRVSTVVGMVGGGGLGLALYNAVQLGFYPRAATLVGVIWLLVSVTDFLADRLRQKPEAERTPASALELISAAGAT